jgi:ribosomal protein S18 acetylase RimI-like enzyme
MIASGTWRCEDWRGAEPASLAHLYRSECRRWQESIGWDFGPSCAIIESARQAGTLPGLLVRGRNGRIAGWSFFVLHDERLQIGGLAAESDSSRRALLRAALASPEAARAAEVSCYLYPQSPAFRRILEQEQFAVEPHHYMAADLLAPVGTQAPSWPSGCTLRSFAEGEAADLVDLVARAYGGSHEARCFAPDLRREQWAHYVSRLMQTEACGRYLPAASFALRNGESQPVAAILMTQIGDRTAHLAQVVVDPRWRGLALASRLVFESDRVLAGSGYRRVTLLVADGNQGARRLYRALGFRDVQTFVHGVRPGARAGS